jgi:MFS family permease
MAQRWKVLLITSVGLFMASLDLFIVNIAFPDLARDFDGASLPSLSWVLNAYAIVFAALLVPAGRIADRVSGESASSSLASPSSPPPRPSAPSPPRSRSWSRHGSCRRRVGR